MQPSARTPEGDPNRCPVCGQIVAVEPSTFPTNDAPCPHCGHLLWFDTRTAAPVRRRSRRAARSSPTVRKRRSRRAALDEGRSPFTAADRVMWALVAAATTLIVLVNDGMAFAAMWLLAMVTFGQVVLPWCFNIVDERIAYNKNQYIGVLCGWALVPGPLVGVIFGVLLPWVYEWEMSSLVGGLLGLMAGPLFAAVEGLTIVAMVDAVRAKS